MTPTPSPIYIEIVGGTEAPWWGVPLVAGSFLLIGAVLGFWFNWLLEGRKAKRELAQRFLDQIRDLGGRLTLHADRVVALLSTRKALLGRADNDPNRMQTLSELQENWVSLNEEIDGIVAAQAALRLISSVKIRESAFDVAFAAGVIGSDEHMSLETLISIETAFVNGKRELEDAIRSSFGV